MFKVGIIGSENSHATTFAKLFNGLIPEHKEEFSDLQVTAVGGIYPEANKKLAESCGVGMIAEKPEAMLGKVDAVMVTARDGKYHAPFIRPFIEAGLPVFIDKPFTRNYEEARALTELAEKKKVPIAGGSSVKLIQPVKELKRLVEGDPAAVKGGDVTAPVDMKNDYGDFWFYSSHLVEICLNIFGYDPEWVWASRNNGGVTAVLHYPLFDITNHFTDHAYQYSATVLLEKEAKYVPMDISDCYLEECRSFADMLRHGNMEFSYEKLIKPVRVLEAMEKSFLTGKRITI